MAYLKSKLLLPGTPEEEFKVQDGIQDLRYIDPLKIKYIRQEKKKKGSDPTIRVRQQEEEVPNPEFDEYYVYTPKIQHPTSLVGQMGAKNQIKIAKDSSSVIDPAYFLL